MPLWRVGTIPSARRAVFALAAACGVASATVISTDSTERAESVQPAAQQAATPISASDAAYDGASDSSGFPSSLSEMPGLRDAGIDATLWGWTTYTSSSQSGYHNFGSGEIQLDLTKTFDNRFSLGTDLDFVDYDGHTRGMVEQLFGSALLSRDSGSLLTAGKFNSPFGAEPRNFWDRLNGTPSLLFRAQPQDLRGIMLTARLGHSHWTLRPFIVTGFNDEDYIPNWPAAGVMAEYKPNDQFTFGITNWIGPGLKSRDASSAIGDEENSGYSAGSAYDEEYSNDYSSDYSSSYGSSLPELTNAWWGPNFKSARTGQLYFLDMQAQWKPRVDLTLVGEFLLGASNAESQNEFWDGVMMLADYDIDDHLHVFGQYSFLNDANGEVTGLDQQLQEVSSGVGYHVNKHLELRAEYRHDFSSETDDIDSVSLHATFGY